MACTLTTGYPTDNGLHFLLADHLGSASVVTSQSGAPISKQLYYPWGEVRYKNPAAGMPAAFQFTDQRVESALGLYDYKARFYDPALGRFISPDTIVPVAGEGNNPNAIGYLVDANYSALVVDYHENQILEQLNQENRIRMEDPSVKLPGVPTNPLAFDRYAYCFNNPIIYTDPSGHTIRTQHFTFAAWDVYNGMMSTKISDLETRGDRWGVSVGITSTVIFGGIGGVAGFFTSGPIGGGVLAGLGAGIGASSGTLASEIGGHATARELEDLMNQANTAIAHIKNNDPQATGFELNIVSAGNGYYKVFINDVDLGLISSSAYEELVSVLNQKVKNSEYRYIEE